MAEQDPFDAAAVSASVNVQPEDAVTVEGAVLGAADEDSNDEAGDDDAGALTAAAEDLGGKLLDAEVLELAADDSVALAGLESTEDAALLLT